MPLQSIPQFPYIKGIVASNQPLALPKGAVQRASNILMTSRGASSPCDGSGVLFAFTGNIQSNFGKFLAETLFDPTGVAPYFLALIQAFDQPLGPPKNLAASDGGVGGTLAAGTYFYVVTALDGNGGETTISNEVSQAVAVNHKINLTWNVVPNAFGYNVYRSTGAGTETLLSGTGLPVPQPSPIAPTVSFTDTGFSNSTILNLTSAQSSPGSVPAPFRVIGWNTVQAFTPQVGQSFVAAGVTPGSFNGTYTVTSVFGPGSFFSSINAAPTGTLAAGGTLTFGGSSPPVSDTTTQTALVRFPNGTGAWTDANIVALFPDTVPGLNTPPAGQAGGGSLAPSGTTNSTINGGIKGMVSLVPMFKQFTNRMVIALGNGFPMQIFSDPTGTPTNPAFTTPIDHATVDAFGVVDMVFTTNHGLDFTQGVGTQVYVQGMSDAAYNTNGHGVSAFVIIAIPATNEVKFRNLNAIGHGPATGGVATFTTAPVQSTFVPSFPVWAATTLLSTGDLIVPLTQPAPAIYLTVIQGGTTGAVEPVWPTGGLASIGKHVKDGTVIYSVTGLLNSAAPPPPGASHIEVFSGALWAFNTSPTNTADGLDGPCSLRQSSINNPNSWNPVNQAFLDKDDGSEGMALAKFTITAQGIPPEGSLIALKNFSPYQVIGVFGAPNLQIQAVSSDMGCIAPRTTIFVPGFGITRYTHLGYATFNGVKDEIVSEQIRPYFFPTKGNNFADIVTVDATWAPLSWAALTANPPQYCAAMPIGNSESKLTRLFCYDLVLKGWDNVDTPFALGSIAQVRAETTNPLTIFGGFLDGALQRWQAGDVQWYTGGALNAVNVAWSFRTLTVASNDTDQRVYVRRFVLTGTNTGAAGTITVSVNQSGVLQPQTLSFRIPANADFDVDFPVQLTGKRFDCTVSSSLQAEIDGAAWESEARPAGVVVSV
jgi:hypothetical protein